jgi:bifunctional non-homologous end joining protein LigD
MAAKKAAPPLPEKKSLSSSGKKAASSVDKQLAKYRSMRDFSTTAEPAGGHSETKESTSLPFVIQKHAATRLHYDFRLGWRGVLKSWAVAKGPSYVVADKRLAVQVEDHPMEYGGFEGTIPKGQYGGGTVMLWDEGTWEPVGDADEGLKTGRLKFILHGHKLQGHWTLIRMGGRAAQESKPNWLLIKEHDEFERSAKSKPITEEAPDSVVTGRDLTQIGEAEDHIWDSRTGLAADERKAATKISPRKKKVALDEYSKESMPGFIAPALASANPEPPTGSGWVHELKLDGYRIEAHLRKGKVRLFSRNGLDWTERMSNVADALHSLDVDDAVIEGEVVVLDEKGLSDFAKLQAAFDENKPRSLTYYCFDLLHLNGHNLRDATLVKRKGQLEELLSAAADDILRYSEHLDTDGAAMFSEACRLGAEGIVSKRVDAKYFSGRNANWTKTKCIRQQEFAIGGFTPPSKGGDGLGALLLGYYDGDVFRYAGRAGTGFTQKSGRALRERLEDLKIQRLPFAEVSAMARKDAVWVKPELVAEVQFRTWTEDGMLRQASFKGLREDKSAKETRRENANPGDPVEADIPKTKAAPRSESRGHATIRLTHANKIIDAASGLTKQMLADYYEAVAEKMLPHIADRPLSIVRCPDGSRGPCFFQKHVKVGLPKGTGSVDVPDKKTGKIEQYITLSTKEALVGMAQMNVLELHPWGSRNDKLEEPDRLVFDLDPDESLPWEVLAESAEEVRKRLQKIGLKSFLKGTGGKGLHIVAAIDPEPAHDWVLIKEFAHAFVQQMEAANPKRYLTKMTKSARTGKIYLDYLRNERGATAVAPYSPRKRSTMPVSVPFAWSVLKEAVMPRYLVANFEQWLPTLKPDPWKALPEMRQKLTPKTLESVGIHHSK